MSYVDKLIPNVNVPVGTKGCYSVEKFKVSPEEARFENMRASFEPGGYMRSIDAGEYTRLMRHGSVLMSDVPAEKRDHFQIVQNAKGIVLLNGLGLGMVLNACLLKSEVEKVLCVEISQDVVDLVWPTYQSKFPGRCEIFVSDAMTFKPPKIRFGAVWHDIWSDICSDNLEGMKLLHRRYGRLTEWQGSWGRSLCEMR